MPFGFGGGNSTSSQGGTQQTGPGQGGSSSNSGTQQGGYAGSSGSTGGLGSNQGSGQGQGTSSSGGGTNQGSSGGSQTDTGYGESSGSSGGTNQGGSNPGGTGYGNGGSQPSRPTGSPATGIQTENGGGSQQPRPTSAPTGATPQLGQIGGGRGLFASAGVPPATPVGAPSTGFSPTIGGSIQPSQDRTSTGFSPSFRQAENASMDSYGRYKTTELASQRRAGEDASMRQLENTRMALLDTISGTESPGYDVIYGGSRFTDFSDHPRQRVRIESGPNRGDYSTAAGRYQFTGSTWDEFARKAGVGDFTPNSQDRAAWALAAQEYKARTGKGLDSALASGEAVGSVGRALSGRWTSLPGGIEETTTEDRFARDFQRNLDQRNNGGSAQNVNNLPSEVSVPPTRPTFAQTYLDGNREIDHSLANGSPSPNRPDNRDYRGPVGLGGEGGLYLGGQPEQQTNAWERPIAQPVREDGITLTPEGQPATGAAEPTRQGRGLGRTVAAAGIDVLAGSIPGGIGTAATIANLGLAATGNPTIGQWAVDQLGEMEPGQPGSTGYGESSVDRGMPSNASTANNPTALPAWTPQSFANVYLRPWEPSDRLTPSERWGRQVTTYLG